MLPLPANRAYCQPPPGLRDRILTDLDVKALNACPDNIDIEAIRLVYALNYNKRGTLHQGGASSGVVGGTANYTVFMAAPAFLIPLETYAILKSWFATLELDVAGRAAIVAAGDTILFQLIDTASGPLPIATYRCTPGALALSGAMIEFGSHIFNHNLATDFYPRNITEVQWPCDYILERLSSLIGVFTLQSAGNFPANTTANVYCNWDSYV